MITLEPSRKRSAPRKVVVPSSIEFPKQAHSFQPRIDLKPRGLQFEKKKLSCDAVVAIRNFKERISGRSYENLDPQVQREEREERRRRRGLLQQNFHENFFSKVELASLERSIFA